ncbi:MAG: hypothetical protein QM741_15485 [Rudaea sp.]|uniref:hypothetical protein n=1 Tax=Rudaea sp. TaxID=2136325 RepID=UPI0039E3FB64
MQHPTAELPTITSRCRQQGEADDEVVAAEREVALIWRDAVHEHRDRIADDQTVRGRRRRAASMFPLWTPLNPVRGIPERNTALPNS